MEDGSSFRMRRSTKRPEGEVRTIVEVGSEGAGGGVSEEEEGEESQRMECRIETSGCRSGAIVVFAFLPVMRF